MYTDHKTLLNFDRQKDLSRRQARWMEELAIYNCKFVYVKGEDNCVADAFSRYPHEVITEQKDAETKACHPYHYSMDNGVFVVLDDVNALQHVAALTDPDNQPKIRTKLRVDKDMINEMKDAYKSDKWCQKLLSASKGMLDLVIRDGLWFISKQLIVPCCKVRQYIFSIAHNALGHFGFTKTYQSIHDSYFWPNMRTALEEGYIPSCMDCQRNKSSTTKLAGPLHPLPVPDDRCDSVTMDFVGPLPLDGGCDYLLTITDRLGSDLRFVATQKNITAEQLAVLFFDHWYCENGLPKEIICDRDKLFVSKFWNHLMLLTGIKAKMSSAYHPQTDGVSERTNKTVEQCLRFQIERNQKNWKHPLPRIRFQMMNMVNKSTKFTPFQLRFGNSPQLLQALIKPRIGASVEQTSVRAIL